MKIITICGSMKFWEDMIKIYTSLSNEGNIVFLPVINGKDKDLLNFIHRRKIEISDEIFVVNINGYIGDNTKDEISYALELGKCIKKLL